MTTQKRMKKNIERPIASPAEAVLYRKSAKGCQHSGIILYIHTHLAHTLLHSARTYYNILSTVSVGILIISQDTGCGSYTIPATSLSILTTYSTGSLVNQTVFLRDTHVHRICGRGEGRGKLSGYTCPDFQPPNRNLLEPIRSPYSRDAETRNLKWHS